MATPEAAWLVVGLGNPGPAYAVARHNAGFRVAAALAAAAGRPFREPERGALWTPATIGGRFAVLIQPQEYMNRSGPPVAGWLAALGLSADNLLVITDDLDLPVGRVKVATGGGDAGHRGIRSIGDSLGHLEFLRVRVGIGRPPPSRDPADYVLAPPAPEEAGALREAEDRAADAVRVVLADGPVAAMNRFNVRPGPPSPEPP